MEILYSCAESFILVQVGNRLAGLMEGWLVFESLYSCAESLYSCAKSFILVKVRNRLAGLMVGWLVFESLYSCAESFILVQVGGWLADSLRLPRQNGLKSSL